jgi:peptide methionine sulfoxide reductase MsrB
MCNFQKGVLSIKTALTGLFSKEKFKAAAGRPGFTAPDNREVPHASNRLILNAHKPIMTGRMSVTSIT